MTSAVPPTDSSATFEKPAAPADRSLALDVLRAWAILLVLGRHILWFPPSPRWDVFFVRLWHQCGWIGVDLFFVLSGYLVGGLLFREFRERGIVSPWIFLVRRGFKIYPAFYAFLALSLLISYELGMTFPSWPQGLVGELLFVQNYYASLWPQTWSLAVEEHFYLLLVWGIYVLSRRSAAPDPFRRLVWVVAGVNILTLAGRLYAGCALQEHWSHLLMRTHWRLDSLFFGVMLAYARHWHLSRLVSMLNLAARWKIWGIALLLAPCIVGDIEKTPYLYTAGLTGLYLGFGWLVADAAVSARQGVYRRMAFLAPVGRWSYSIYLWHVTVYYVVVPFLHRHLPGTPYVIEIAIYVALAIATGATMFKCIEGPALRWRERWCPSRIRSRGSDV